MEEVGVGVAVKGALAGLARAVGILEFGVARECGGVNVPFVVVVPGWKEVEDE